MKMKENGKKRVKAWSSNLSPENGDDIGDDKRQKRKRKKAPLLKLWSKQKKSWNKIFKKKEEADHANAPRALDTWSRGGPQSIEQEKRGTSQGSLQPLFFFFLLPHLLLFKPEKKEAESSMQSMTNFSRERGEKVVPRRFRGPVRWCSQSSLKLVIF